MIPQRRPRSDARAHGIHGPRRNRHVLPFRGSAARATGRCSSTGQEQAPRKRQTRDHAPASARRTGQPVRKRKRSNQTALPAPRQAVLEKRPGRDADTSAAAADTLPDRDPTGARNGSHIRPPKPRHGPAPTTRPSLFSHFFSLGPYRRNQTGPGGFDSRRGHESDGPGVNATLPAIQGTTSHTR